MYGRWVIGYAIMFPLQIHRSPSPTPPLSANNHSRIIRRPKLRGKGRKSFGFDDFRGLVARSSAWLATVPVPDRRDSPRNCGTAASLRRSAETVGYHLRTPISGPLGARTGGRLRDEENQKKEKSSEGKMCTIPASDPDRRCVLTDGWTHCVNHSERRTREHQPHQSIFKVGTKYQETLGSERRLSSERRNKQDNYAEST